MKELIALAIQKVVEAKGYEENSKVREAFDSLWDGIRLIQALEFDFYPERKTRLLPLRLSLEQLSHPLGDVLEKHIFPNRYWKKMWMVDEREQFNKQYQETKKEFQTILSFLEQVSLCSEVKEKERNENERTL